jgi:hypothetical protein
MASQSASIIAAGRGAPAQEARSAGKSRAGWESSNKSSIGSPFDRARGPRGPCCDARGSCPGSRARPIVKKRSIPEDPHHRAGRRLWAAFKNSSTTGRVQQPAGTVICKAQTRDLHPVGGLRHGRHGRRPPRRRADRPHRDPHRLCQLVGHETRPLTVCLGVTAGQYRARYGCRRSYRGAGRAGRRPGPTPRRHRATPGRPPRNRGAAARRARRRHRRPARQPRRRPSRAPRPPRGPASRARPGTRRSHRTAHPAHGDPRAVVERTRRNRQGSARLA